MKKELQGYIALAIVSFFWGTTYIASRIGVQHTPGIFLSGVRQFASGLILVSFFLLKGKKLPEWQELKKISLQGNFIIVHFQWFAHVVVTIYQRRPGIHYCCIGSIIYCIVQCVDLKICKDNQMDGRRFIDWFHRCTYDIL
jgi:drug/metabolite transporter (DMT)-like permease